MTSKKIIARGCPAYTDENNQCTRNHLYCADIFDCKIKYIIAKCKKHSFYSPIAKLVEDVLDVQEVG